MFECGAGNFTPGAGASEAPHGPQPLVARTELSDAHALNEAGHGAMAPWGHGALAMATTEI